MVLFTLVELTLDIGIWVAKKSIGMGYYLIWGTPETKEDKILQEMEKLMKENEQLILEVEHIRNAIQEKTSQENQDSEEFCQEE